MPPPGLAPSETDEFVTQLHLLVHEEAPLWEAPWESTVVGADRSETHGPWPPEACSWALLRWFEAGLLRLYRMTPGSTDDITDDEVRHALTHPAEWQPATTGLYLLPTDRGLELSIEEWSKLLDDATAT